MNRQNVDEMMEFLFTNRAPALSPEALAEVFDRLVWCLEDNDSALLSVREDWLRIAPTALTTYRADACPTATGGDNASGDEETDARLQIEANELGIRRESD